MASLPAARGRALRRPVLAISARPDGLARRLERLGGAAALTIRTPEDLTAIRAAGGAAVLGELTAGGCLFVDADVPDAGGLARAGLEAGATVILADGMGLPPDDLAALEGLGTGTLHAGGQGIGSLAMATLLGQVRAGALGPLTQVAVRTPAGRRRLPASNHRTPFEGGARLSFDFDLPTVARLAALAGPAYRLLELCVPGAGAVTAPTELVANPGAERYVAHGLLDGVGLEVDLDRAMVGEGPLELEVRGRDGALVARWDDEGRDLLLRLDGRRADHVPLDPRGADELLVRHALAGATGTKRLAAPRSAVDAGRTVRRHLAEAEARRRSRPLDLVLVHVPRFRNRHDELRLPSLAIARLSAFMRAYGFETRVVDLAGEFEAVPLGVFADDAAVDAWLGGGANAGIDAAVDAMWPALAEALPRRTLVGFSIVDYYGNFQMNLASCLARKVRAETGYPTVLGGERDQVDADRGLGEGMPFDYVCEGDGEVPLLGLAHLLAYGDRRIQDVPGMCAREGGELIRNRVVRSHMAAMPRPDFDGMPLERYQGRLSEPVRRRLVADGLLGADDPVDPLLYLPFGFVKGCTASCTFCSAKESLDIQAPEKAAGELIELSERYGARDFVFLNNLVNIGPKWLERFCRFLVDADAGIQWTDSCRPTKVSQELASLMRQSGCLLLNFGAESGSDAILERMHKGLKRADILATLRHTHQAGILNRVNLIAGYFHETPEDVDLTVSLVETLQQEIDVIGCFQGFYLFPGMGVQPELEGIALRPDLDRLKTGQLTMAYDEVGGLKWEEKRDTIDASRNRILGRIEELGIRTIDKVNEYDLFWLSRRFDKATVTRYLLADPTGATGPFPNCADLQPGGKRGTVGVG